MLKKIDYVCSACGSRDVKLDSWAEWSVQRQHWELAGVLDAAYCENCGGETSLRETSVGLIEGLKLRPSNHSQR